MAERSECFVEGRCMVRERERRVRMWERKLGRRVEERAVTLTGISDSTNSSSSNLDSRTVKKTEIMCFMRSR